MTVEDTVKKIVVGLRGLAPEAGTHSDRINGYAAELAQAIGYAEPSADLLAARELAIGQLHHLDQAGMVTFNGFVIVDRDGVLLFNDDLTGSSARIRRGDADKSMLVLNALAGIAEGRRLAAEEQTTSHSLADQMIRWNTERVQAKLKAMKIAPERLTVTVDGPQGSGKTRLANWLNLRCSPQLDNTFSSLKPHIIEMREGRPFDVRNETFLS